MRSASRHLRSPVEGFRHQSGHFGATLRCGPAFAAAVARHPPVMDTPHLYCDLWPSRRRRVLVVDDDPTLRLLLRTTLGRGEFGSEEVGSADEPRSGAAFWRPS